MLTDLFKIVGGSTTGFRHVEEGRNNQDAYFIKADERAIVGVVADGCSEYDHSEVGAHLLGRVFTNILYRSMAFGEYTHDAELWGITTSRLRYQMDLALKDLFYTDKDRRRFIYENLLCTLIGFVITPERSYFITMGDGVVIVNGQVKKFGPFPNNRPPYFAYTLDSGKVVHEECASMLTRDLNTLIIATDGIDKMLESSDEQTDLFQFVDNANLSLENPFTVSRQLRTLATKKYRVEDGMLKTSRPLLDDDTTLIAVRRVNE